MQITIWFVYILACALALACWWWLTKPLKSDLVRYCLRFPMVVLCFTPVPVDGVMTQWSPAIAAVALEILSSNSEAMMTYLIPLIATLALSAGLAVYLGLQKREKPQAIQIDQDDKTEPEIGEAIVEEEPADLTDTVDAEPSSDKGVM